MIVTPRRFSAEVLRRGLRTLTTSKLICIRICLPWFVVTCPYTTFRPQCRSVAFFAVTASMFVQLTKGNCGANQGGQTCPQHPESIINSCTCPCSHVSDKRVWGSTFKLTEYRHFELSSTEKIHNSSSVRPISPIVFVHLRQTRWLRRSVWWPRLFNLFARVAFAGLCDVGFRLARAFTFAMRLVVVCTNNPPFCGRIFHSFGTHHRIACVQFSILRDPFQNDSLCLSCHISFPCQICPCLSVFGIRTSTSIGSSS